MYSSQIHLVTWFVPRMLFGPAPGHGHSVVKSRSRESVSENGNILRELAWKLHHRSHDGKGSKHLLSVERVCHIHLWNALPR